MTDQSNASDKFQEIAFLDTNAMHYVRLYVNLAHKEKLYPFGREMEETAAVIRRKGDRLRKAYDRGLDVVTFCKTQHLLIHYSNISILELLVGRAKGEALLRAAKEGVPEQQWTGFVNDDHQVNAYLQDDILKDIRREMPQLITKLECIRIYAVSDKDNMIPELALKLAGLVYMTTADCVIFAQALAVRAQHVLTYDDYFRGIVNQVRSSRRRDEVRRLIEGYVPDIRLPCAPDAKKIRSSRKHVVQ